MSYRLEQDESVEKGIRRIATEQIDKAIDELDDDQIDRHETVHQVRKRCKKLRALVRLVRPEFDDYSDENKYFRDAARELSYVRDATAIIETFDELVERFEDQIEKDQFKSVRDALLEQRRQVAKEEEKLDQKLSAFREQMVESRDRVQQWELSDSGFDAVAGGVEKTYRRARKRMHEAFADPTTERFHEFRKRAKYHWYHMRLLRDVWKPVVKERRDEADDLQDYIGDDHDLAVFTEHLLEDPEKYGEKRDVQALLGLIDHRRAELQQKARPLAFNLFAEKPSRFIDRFAEYWKTWKKQEQRQPKLAEPEVVAGR